MHRTVALIRRTIVATLALGLSGLGGGQALAANSCPKPPDLPANFVSEVDNPYFPLSPGTTFHYEGKEDGEDSSDDFAVTNDTKVILGVTTTVVHDEGFINGRLREDTFDWFAQDSDGNVWYFGEDTKELNKHGEVVSTEGSWEAGVDGARAGIFMPADPKVGDVFKQEHSKGVAEDCFKILDLNAKVKVPFVSSHHALETKEFSKLDPGVVEHKFYVKDIGDVFEETVKGGNDFLKLISVDS
jgi:hypothetical protein